MKNKKSKKIYSAPSLEVVNVDHEISLIMMTTPPGDPPGSSALEVNPGSGSPKGRAPSESNNPFGTDSPQY